MPSKYRQITEIAAKATVEMCTSSERYLSFLTTAAHNYKYSFQDQLLIHAQMPDATACAEMAVWNRLGRWINKGSKGIALLNDESAKYKLRYVFDVSATNSYAKKTVQRWEMQRRYENEVAEALRNSFREGDNARSFPAVVGDVSAYAAQDNISDYLTQLMQVKARSLLDELNSDSLERSFTELLEKSIAYMTLVRCGYNADDYYLPEEFELITDFDTAETASVVGTAASDISKMLLREIEKTVVNLQKAEKNQIRTFENKSSARYNADRNSNIERSNEH